MSRSHWSRWLISAGVAVALGAIPMVALADALHRVISNWEKAAPGRSAARDCGFSHPLPSNPGMSVWLWCDTTLVAGGNSVLVIGSTASIAPSHRGLVPTDLSELPAEGNPIGHLPNRNAPHQFLPLPQGVKLPGGRPCPDSHGNSYPATWMTGVAREPSTVDDTQLLITFTDVCVHDHLLKITVESFGIAEYRPATNTITSMTRVFRTSSGQELPDRLILGSPVFSGGNLFLFSHTCTSSDRVTCHAGDVFLTRTAANRASWRNGRSYRFLGSVVPRAAPLAATADTYPVFHRLVMIEQTSTTGVFRVYTATHPTGPWTLDQRASGRVQCGGGELLNLCRALIGHPELSKANELLLSFYDPGTNHDWITSRPW
jgi:hypothetical protein